MRTLFFGIAGALALIGLGVLGWTKRDQIMGALPKVKEAARSVSGRVATSFNKLIHTEQEQPVASNIGFKA